MQHGTHGQALQMGIGFQQDPPVLLSCGVGDETRPIILLILSCIYMLSLPRRQSVVDMLEGGFRAGLLLRSLDKEVHSNPFTLQNKVNSRVRGKKRIEEP
jgi:hypothetical protein